MKLNEIKPNKANPRVIKDDKFKKLVRSLQSFPQMMQKRPIVVDGDMTILGGNMRYKALCEIYGKNGEIPDEWVTTADGWTDEQKREFIIKDNANYGEWAVVELLNDWSREELDEWGVDVPEWDDAGEDEEETETNSEITKQKLTDEFLVPPLSILDTTQGYWQERKNKWKNIGLKSEQGRDDKMLSSLQKLSMKSDQGKAKEESIFDPVLCEVLYSWFCKEGGQILDPFAGGSVRGIVANYKKMNYTGFDIRQEQIDANNEQKEICEKENPLPVWICADSNTMEKYLAEDFEADFVFSCPPYADLEVYSDIDGDLSNMEYNDFKQVYSSIIQKSCDRLKDNRFACFVVGEVRDKKGIYYNFVSDTIKAFESAGMNYYNEIVLKTNISAKALTCGIGMRKTRKVGKVHQNVLVFLKGDPKKAVEYLGDINIFDMQMLE